MLKLAKESDRGVVFSLLHGAFGAKTGGIIAAYGFDSQLLQVWYDENGTVAARLDGAMSLYYTDNDDSNELSAFLNAVGYSSLFASKECFERLKITPKSTGTVMKYSGSTKSEPVCDVSPELRKVYTLISENIPDSFPENAYKYFLSDFTYRQRRSLSRARGIITDGNISACALTSAETPDSAVISGVACDKKYRGKGYGGLTVSSLANELTNEGKAVYVFVLNEKACGFYEHIGFTREGEWAQLII